MTDHCFLHRLVIRNEWINVYKALRTVPGSWITLWNTGYFYNHNSCLLPGQGQVSHSQVPWGRWLWMDHWGLWGDLLHHSATTWVTAKPLPLKPLPPLYEVKMSTVCNDSHPAHLLITQVWAQDQDRTVAVPHPSCHGDQLKVETGIPLRLYGSSQISKPVGEVSLFSLVKTGWGCEARTAGYRDSQREQGWEKGTSRILEAPDSGHPWLPCYREYSIEDILLLP